MVPGAIDPATILQSAMARHRAGQLDLAEALYRQVLAITSDEPTARHMLGVIAYQRGNHPEAVTLIASALPRLPHDADLLVNLGNAQQALGDITASIESCRRAIALRPDFALAHAALARALNDSGAHGAALEAANRAASLDPALFDAPVQMAVALTALGRPVEAGSAYQRALRIDPDQPAVLARFGQVLSILGHNDAALTCHRRALELRPNDAECHLALARSLMHQMDTAGAIGPLRFATAHAPDCVEAWQRLGTCLSTVGEFEAAGVALRRAVALAPDDPEILRLLAAIDQPADDPAELQRLQTILSCDDLPDERRIAAGFAAGERLDRLDRYDEAFPCFATANALVRARRAAEGRRPEEAIVRRQVDEIIEHCSPAFFAGVRSWGRRSDRPVLVVGMPRSGTSLVEQILATHPQITGAGELLDLSAIARRMMLANSGRDLAQWRPATARQEGAAYLARLEALGAGAARVIDKMPDNIFVLGIAVALLPDLRVILCRRDPRDICLSCFFQNFVEGYDYANDLADCAQQALQVLRLADHWEKVLPARTLLTVHYEAIVADVEAEARRMVAFLELPWDPACLGFHRTHRPVLTASSWQVRQPLYSSAVGRWRHYAKHLGPMLDILSGEHPHPRD